MKVTRAGDCRSSQSGDNGLSFHLLPSTFRIVSTVVLEPHWTGGKLTGIGGILDDATIMMIKWGEVATSPLFLSEMKSRVRD